MVELLVDIRLPNADKISRVGEVIAAKLSGYPWGLQEYKDFLIVIRDDPTLEAKLRASPDLVMSYPYATYDPKGNLFQKSIWYLTYSDIQDPTLHNTNIAKQPILLPESYWFKNVVVQPSVFSRVVSTVRGMLGL